MTWNRAKQTYWVASRGDPYTVRRIKDNGYVCDVPIIYCMNITFMIQLCFALNDTIVKQLIENYHG